MKQHRCQKDYVRRISVHVCLSDSSHTPAGSFLSENTNIDLFRELLFQNNETTYRKLVTRKYFAVGFLQIGHFSPQNMELVRFNEGCSELQN